MTKRDMQQIERDREYTLRRVCEATRAGGTVRQSDLFSCAATLARRGLLERVKGPKAVGYRATAAGFAALADIDRALLGKEGEA
ncbi:hypothetical protein [Pseudomonas sp.]|uniref:hypothetical protein n=1 Tax=Pseudomonas sp. TaxID=306 RepID=UPI0025891981|nr:hypothetical protein [Pseudomonas sp.]